MQRPLCALVLLGTLIADPGRADTHDAYAAPNTWGPPVSLRSHLGSAPYTVSYAALGGTVVIGEVTYVREDGQTVVKEFNQSISFRTGNVVATPAVRFKGVPLGSAVRVSSN